MAIVSGPVARSAMRTLKSAADIATDGTVSALQAAASSRILRLSLRVRIAFGLAVVFLMIAKPAAGESLLVLGLAAVMPIATSVTRRIGPSKTAEGYR